MTNLSDIIERLEKAEAGSRELDCYLWVIAKGGDARMHYIYGGEFVWERGIDGMWIRSVEKFKIVPAFTTSVDAAISLAEKVLPGAYAIEVSADPSGCGAKATHWPKGLGGENENRSEAVSQTMALALCRAILKAKAQQQEGGE